MMMHGLTREWRLLSLASALAVLAGAAHPAIAQNKEAPARSIDSVEGKDTFTAYCATCHGRDAKGNGPAAAALKGPVPDLTTIGRRHAGKFDGLAVEHAITGRDRRIAAHGSEEMPVWGPVFRSLRGQDAGALVRMSNLVKYIESIQQK